MTKVILFPCVYLWLGLIVIGWTSLTVKPLNGQAVASCSTVLSGVVKSLSTG